MLLTHLHVRSVQAQDGQTVELELVLAVDTSLSINADEYAIQMGGLALAFRNPHVVSAIEAAEDNGFQGRRRAIDISGDGRNNSGLPPAPMCDRVVDAGIVVNGLAILDGDIMLDAYYAEHVTGGTASFVVVANTFQDYPGAIRKKLQRKILAPLAGEPAEAPPPT